MLLTIIRTVRIGQNYRLKFLSLAILQTLSQIHCGTAAFGEMTDSNEKLYISKIIQAAKIVCNEDGTEAAAVTLEAMDVSVFHAPTPDVFPVG
mgnify:CR=1 FL=1